MNAETKRRRQMILDKLNKNYPDYLWTYAVIRHWFKCETEHQALAIFLDYRTLSFSEFITKYKKIYKSDMPDLLTIGDMARDKSTHKHTLINSWNITKMQVKKLLSNNTKAEDVTRVLFSL